MRTGVFIDWEALPDFGAPEMFIDYSVAANYGEWSEFDNVNSACTNDNHYAPVKTTQSGISYSDGFEGFQIDQDFLIEDVLAVNDFAVMAAPPKSYKTFAAIHLAACVASGLPFGNHSIDKQGLVIYIAAESGTGAKKRLKSWCIENSGVSDIEERIKKNFKIISYPLKPTNEETRKSLINAISEIENNEQTPVSLVVFDTLARCYEGEENSNTDMGVFVSAIDEIKLNKNCASLVVHHHGKNGELRAASALAGAYDAYYTVTKRDYDKKSERYLQFRIEQLKENEAGESIFFKLNSNDLYVSAKGKTINALAVGEHYELNTFSGLFEGSDLINIHKDLADEVMKEPVVMGVTEPAINATQNDFKDAHNHKYGSMSPEQQHNKLEIIQSDGETREAAKGFTELVRVNNSNNYCMYTLALNKLKSSPTQRELYEKIYGEIGGGTYNKAINLDFFVDKEASASSKRKDVIKKALTEMSRKNIIIMDGKIISLPKPPAAIMST
ncbi:AAA family ATPase [Enterobacter ludwigii]